MIERLANILIDNAVRHSVGSEDVRVELHCRKNRNILTVSNKGEYIAPEELSRLFDRFYRTDKSRTSSTGGFGLGLSIAKAIADKHKGTLTAASSPDGLTTFTFTWRD
jgi:signal transduction histidine kinase